MPLLGGGLNSFGVGEERFLLLFGVFPDDDFFSTLAVGFFALLLLELRLGVSSSEPVSSSISMSELNSPFI